MNIESINTLIIAVIIIILGVAFILFIHRLLGCQTKIVVIGIGYRSFYFNNKWIYKYHYFTGKVSARFVAKSDDSQMIYRSNLRKGDVEFHLYDKTGNILATFSGNNTADTLTGFFREGEKYRVRAKLKGAKKGNFFFKME
jgi:hypothetical protein